MKIISTILAVALLGLGACGGNDTTAPSEPELVAEGLTVGRLDNSYVEGTYKVAEHAIRSEVEHADTYESIRFLDLAGNELFRSEIYGNVAKESGDFSKGNMWHYGVALDSTKTIDDQPEVSQWIHSHEAQLVASLWRDLAASSYNYESGPLNGVWRYGVHLDEALAFDAENLEEAQEVNCNCYGKCGPGCFSVGSASYCRKHDCCCRTYGSAACYTWCFVNPKCPAAICR
jgi:hypothetical protein